MHHFRWATVGPIVALASDNIALASRLPKDTSVDAHVRRMIAQVLAARAERN